MHTSTSKKEADPYTWTGTAGFRFCMTSPNCLSLGPEKLSFQLLDEVRLGQQSTYQGQLSED